MELDPIRRQDAARRAQEFRREAEYYQRRVDSCNAQAAQLERTWRLREPNVRMATYDGYAPTSPAEV